MNIKDKEFAELLAKLSAEGDILEEESRLDKLDYHWLLVTLLGAFDKKAILRILDDRTGKEISYEIIKVEIDDDKLNLIKLNLRDLEKKQVDQREFLVKEVEDARIMLPAKKYYVKTEENLFRFITSYDE